MRISTRLPPPSIVLLDHKSGGVSIQGNVTIDRASCGDDVRVLYARLPRILGALVQRALGFAGVPAHLLCPRCLFDLEPLTASPGLRRALISNPVLELAGDDLPKQRQGSHDL